MDELLKTIVTGFPNLAVGIVALVWSGKLIERMVTNQETLVAKLLEMCAKNESLSERLQTAEKGAQEPF